MSLMNSGFVSDVINGITSVTDFGVGFCLNNSQKNQLSNKLGDYFHK